MQRSLGPPHCASSSQGSQRPRAEADVHARTFGSQIWPGPQSLPSLQPTQLCSAASQKGLSTALIQSLLPRQSTQLRVAVSQTCLPPQSIVVKQSTQALIAGSHTESRPQRPLKHGVLHTLPPVSSQICGLKH